MNFYPALPLAIKRPVKERCTWCGREDPYLDYHPLRDDKDRPICVPCWKPTREAILWASRLEEEVNSRFGELKQYIADCLRPELLLEMEELIARHRSEANDTDPKGNVAALRTLIAMGSL